MPEIFISYASADRLVAQGLADLFNQQGWSVWWDRVIPVGKPFDRAIEEALDSARCVVVLWSSSSVNSDWVMAEASEGLSRGVLLPIIISETRIPLAFRRLQTADLVGWQPGQAHPELASLLEAVEELVGPPLASPPAPVDEPPRDLPSIVASKVKTAFQKEVAELIDYAADNFQAIRRRQIREEDDGDVLFEITFTMSESDYDGGLVRKPDGKYEFYYKFSYDRDESVAEPFFNQKTSELQSMLGAAWTLKVNEHRADITNRSLIALNNQDKLKLNWSLENSYGECMIYLYLSQV